MNSTPAPIATRSTVPMRHIVFGVYFFLLLLMALFPPFYLSVSGSTTLIAGIPLPMFYWISNAVLVALGVWALYVTELSSGDIVDDPDEGDQA